MKIETIFEDKTIRVCTIGRNYDFVATIENKTEKDIKIVFNEEIFDGTNTDFDYISQKETITIKSNDWQGILASGNFMNTLTALKQGNFKIEEIEEIETIYNY